jgi:hypothetical protein
VLLRGRPGGSTGITRCKCLVTVAVLQLALDLGEGGLLKAALCLVHGRGRAALRPDHQKTKPGLGGKPSALLPNLTTRHLRHNGYTGHRESLYSGL